MNRAIAREHGACGSAAPYRCDDQGFAGALDDQLYAEGWRLRQMASTQTLAASQWLCEELPELLCGASTAPDGVCELSILSIGCGAGEIDLPLLTTLVDGGPHRVRFTAFEPNAHHRRQFQEGFWGADLDRAVELCIHPEPFSPQACAAEQYDLLLLAHVLYYFDDPGGTVRAALELAKPDGHVIIVHQTAAGIPELQRRHMRALKGHADEHLTSEEIAAVLDRDQLAYGYHEVPATVDVSECLRQSEKGHKLLSFFLECDLRGLDPARTAKPIETLAQLARTDHQGRALIHEPAGIFVLRPTPITPAAPVQRHPHDDDPVTDYRELARGLDWQALLATAQAAAGTAPPRLLDIACGTGRWLRAFDHYVAPVTSSEGMVYDCLDPCPSALSRLVARVRSPLRLGDRYNIRAQDAELGQGRYHLIWSLHGLYGIPARDLPALMAKCRRLLAPGGVGLIALASRASFYVDFYRRYLDVFHAGQGQPFTSAEDVLAALRAEGIAHRVGTINYEECIASDDETGLERYIRDEATVNSFNRDSTSDAVVESKHIRLADLFAHASMAEYLRAFLKDGSYRFPQAVRIIEFRND